MFTAGPCPYLGYISEQNPYAIVVAAEAREQASSKLKEYRRVQEVSL
jgi:hypothetical protein